MKSKRPSPFNPQVYLESVGVSRKLGEFRKKQTIFAQGDAADTVIYIQKGSVKFTVVMRVAKKQWSQFSDPEISLEKALWEPNPFAWVLRLPLSQQPS